MSAQATNRELTDDQRAELLAAAEELAQSDGPLLDRRDWEAIELIETMHERINKQ